MSQKKLQRFAEIDTFNNVKQFPKNMAGNWHQHFNNTHPIILELACGKGEYTIGLATLHKNKNYIGVDLKGNRIWVGAKKCLEQNILNAAFLRTQIEHLDSYFKPGEVNEIWITFPDPQLRISKLKKRLTHPKFLRTYKNILKEKGIIHLKTDSPDLYFFTKIVIQKYECTIINSFENLYAQPNQTEELKIKTHYENLNISGSNCIYYLSFYLPEKIKDIETDQLLKEIFFEKKETTSTQ